MKQFLAISAIGKDRPGLAHDVVRTVADCGASITESRMLPLGGEFAMQLLVAGNWHAMARLEADLKRLADSAGLLLHTKRTEPRGLREDHIPYSIDVIGPDQPGIVAGLAGFFTGRNIGWPKSRAAATQQARPARHVRGADDQCAGAAAGCPVAGGLRGLL
jgi:glycine cleavage system transcriptional repressor